MLGTSRFRELMRVLLSKPGTMEDAVESEGAILCPCFTENNPPFFRCCCISTLPGGLFEMGEPLGGEKPSWDCLFETAVWGDLDSLLKDSCLTMVLPEGGRCLEVEGWRALRSAIRSFFMRKYGGNLADIETKKLSCSRLASGRRSLRLSSW